MTDAQLYMIESRLVHTADAGSVVGARVSSIYRVAGVTSMEPKPPRVLGATGDEHVTSLVMSTVGAEISMTVATGS